jgi:hypothetical protein
MRAFDGSILCFAFTGASGDGGLLFLPDLVPFFEADRIPDKIYLKILFLELG